MDSKLSEFLDDASLIANYAVLSGTTIPSSFLSVLAKAREKVDLTWTDTEVLDLQNQMVEATRWIHPITITDLRRRDPLKPLGAWARIGVVLGKTALALYVLVMLALCGHYTIWNTRASQVLSEMKVVDHTPIYLLIARDQATRSNIPEVQQKSSSEGAAPIVFIDVLQAVRDHVISVQRINDSWRSLDHRFNPAGYFGPEPAALYLRVSDLFGESRAPTSHSSAIAEVIRQSFSEGDAEGVSEGKLSPFFAYDAVWGCQDILKDYGGWLSAQEKASKKVVERIEEKASLPEDADGKMPSGVSLGAKTVPNISETNFNPTQRSAAIDYAGCVLGIGDVGAWLTEMNELQNETVFLLEDRVDFLSRWLLPAIYGALGALLFHARFLLALYEPMGTYALRQRTPNFFEVVFRSIIAGFVGIVITWVWSGGVDEKLEVFSISFGILFASFLSGYALPVVFDILERFISALTMLVARLFQDERREEGRGAKE